MMLTPCIGAGADVAQLEQALKLSLQQQGAHCQAIQSSVQQVSCIRISCRLSDRMLVACEPCG